MQYKVKQRMDVQTVTQVSNEPCGEDWQTKPTSEACQICTFKVETTLATAPTLHTPSAIHYTAGPCHVLVADVQMVVPLLARQCPGSSKLGTWTHRCLAKALLTG